jgi:hypothetical protein
MNILAMKKLNSTQTNPSRRINLLSFGIFGALDRSRIMNPKPPIVNRKLDASPSIMYCPFTLEKKRKTMPTQMNIFKKENFPFTLKHFCANLLFLPL